MKKAIAVAVAALSIVSACSDGSPGNRPVAEVVDSASTRILTYPALAEAPAGVIVDTVPRFRVGWDPSGRLFQRIEDMAVLADGSVAVVDGGGTQEIVLLDQGGNVLEVLGGPGEGPGEFTGVSRVVPYGSSGLIAQDIWDSRATIFDGGELEGTYRLPFLDQKAMLGEVDGAVVFGPPLMLVQGRLYPEPWRGVAISISRPPFSAEDTLAVVDWDQSLEFNGRDPWAASGLAAFDGQRVLYGRGDRPEVIWYELDGHPAQIVRWKGAPKPVSDSAYAESESAFLAQMEGRLPPENARQFLDMMAAQHQGVVPYFDRLFVDGTGTVWLGEFLRPEQRSGGVGRTYHLFTGQGEALGTAVLPAKLRVFDISRDLVVGYELGPYDEVAAVAYGLHWTGDRP